MHTKTKTNTHNDTGKKLTQSHKYTQCQGHTKACTQSNKDIHTNTQPHNHIPTDSQDT